MLGILITQCAPVPKGSIFMFDGPPPAGWQVLTDFNGRFPLGDTIGGILGGDSMHAHIVSGITDTVLGWGRPGTFFGMRGHAHSYNLTTYQEKHLPPYRTFIFAKALIDMDYLPRNAVIISYDSTFPSDFSDLTGSMLGYFPRGSNVAGNTGGYDKHTHWNMNGHTNSMIVIGDTTRCLTPGIGRSSPHSYHTHYLSFQFDSAYHIPPYRTVRFWKVVSDSVIIEDPCKVIYMFDTLPSCVSLIIDTSFIGLFPRAYDTTKLTGGQMTHAHNYYLSTSEVDDSIVYVDFPATGANCITQPHDHGYFLRRVSSEASNMPPYRTVIFSVCLGSNVSERQLKFSSDEYKIYDVSGKVIYAGKGTPTLKNLPRGVYFVVYYSDERMRVIKRIIR